MNEEIKTANQLYKESNSNLSFKDWIESEKEKGVFIKNDTLTNVVESVLNSKESIKQTETSLQNNKILGLSKPVIVISILIIASAIGYKIYSLKNK